MRLRKQHILVTLTTTSAAMTVLRALVMVQTGISEKGYGRGDGEGAWASRRKIGMIKPKPPPGSPLPRPLGHMPRFKVPNMKHASPVFSL